MPHFKKIALCFLTYGDLTQEAIWRGFLNGHESLYNLYIHNKSRLSPQSCFKIHCLKETISTKWGDLSLVRATMLLFKQAFENDKQNEYFVLLSDKCIPLRPFSLLYQYLLSIDNNIICSWADPTRHCHLANVNFFKKNDFKKQNQWMVLNRSTVKFFLDHEYFDLFGDNFFAPDEHYFVNLCVKFKLDFVNLPITFANWDEWSDHNECNILPKTYDLLTDQALQKILSVESYFFMRKISSKCQLPDYFKCLTNQLEPSLSLPQSKKLDLKAFVLCREQQNNRSAWELAQIALSRFFRLEKVNVTEIQERDQIRLLMGKETEQANLITITDDMTIFDENRFIDNFSLIWQWLMAPENQDKWDLFNAGPIKISGQLCILSETPAILSYETAECSKFIIYNNRSAFENNHQKCITSVPFLSIPRPAFSNIVKGIDPGKNESIKTIDRLAAKLADD